MFLFLLLLFAEDLTRKYFPSNMLSMDLNEMSEGGALLLIATGFLGWICFFIRIEKANQTEIKNLFSKGTSKFISVIGCLLSTLMTCVMLMNGVFKFEEDIYNSAHSQEYKGWAIFITAFVVLFSFLMIIALPAIYYGRYKKLPAINPTLRYLLIFPAIYFVTACMNEYVLKIKGWDISAPESFIKILFSWMVHTLKKPITG